MLELLVLMVLVVVLDLASTARRIEQRLADIHVELRHGPPPPPDLT